MANFIKPPVNGFQDSEDARGRGGEVQTRSRTEQNCVRLISRIIRQRNQGERAGDGRTGGTAPVGEIKLLAAKCGAA
jgi:hypothetical protein